MKELQITPYLRSSKIIASLLLLTGSFFLLLSLFQLFIWARVLALQHMNICVDQGKFRTCKILQKPISQNAGSGKRNEQNSYYSPPLVGKSNGEDTITTHFDWKKQKPILLVDRWEDQPATEDTTATLQQERKKGPCSSRLSPVSLLGHFALSSPAELRLDWLKRDCSQSISQEK